MEKDGLPLEPSGDRRLQDGRLKARLLVAEAVFEAARAGERRGTLRTHVGRLDAVWFMSEKKLNEEAAGQAHRGV